MEIKKILIVEDNFLVFKFYQKYFQGCPIFPGNTAEENRKFIKAVNLYCFLSASGVKVKEQYELETNLKNRIRKALSVAPDYVVLDVNLGNSDPTNKYGLLFKEIFIDKFYPNALLFVASQYYNKFEAILENGQVKAYKIPKYLNGDGFEEVTQTLSVYFTNYMKL